MDKLLSLAATLLLLLPVWGARAASQGAAAGSQARGSSALINAAQLLDDVKTLADDSMEGRRAGTPGGARARAYIVRRFKEAGIRPFGASYEQPVKLSEKDGGGAQGANVVGFVAGTERPDLYLVVTAHYDHLGVRGGQVYNGADDNASGVAALLQLGAYFSRHRPAHSIIFAALDAEEGSGAGARTLVGAPPVERRAIALDVNLDMVSHSQRGELYAAGAAHYPFLRPDLERVAAHAPVRLLLGHDRPVPTPHDDWTYQSDQQAFHREHIPFVYFGVEDHKDYHQPTDDFETITPVFFVHAVETILDAVKLLDADLAALQQSRAR